MKKRNAGVGAEPAARLPFPRTELAGDGSRDQRSLPADRANSPRGPRNNQDPPVAPRNTAASTPIEGPGRARCRSVPQAPPPVVPPPCTPAKIPEATPQGPGTCTAGTCSASRHLLSSSAAPDSTATSDPSPRSPLPTSQGPGPCQALVNACRRQCSPELLRAANVRPGSFRWGLALIGE